MPYASHDKKLEHDRKYREEHREQVRQSGREWRENHRERCVEINRKYRNSNREKVRASNKKYAQEHRKEDSERVKRYRARNPEKIAKYAAKYQKEHKDIINAITHARNARKNKNGGRYTASEWRQLVDLYGGKCVRCGKNSNMTVDHIVPVFNGGRNEIDNIQPLCGGCNSSKRIKTADYRLLRSIDEAISMQTGVDLSNKTYEDVPYWNLWESIRYEE